MVHVDAFLAHYGVKGMRWGVRRDKTPRASRRERLEAAYRTKMSDVDAKAKANGRIRTEKILLGVGAVAAVTAISVVAGKKLHSEFAPISLKSGSNLQNVNQFGKKLDLDKVTFATFKKGDNLKYRENFTKELLGRIDSNGKVYATQLKATKDLNIPSKSQARKLFVEWEKSRGITPTASSVTNRMINNNRGSQALGNSVSDGSFLSYVGKKGFDGIQDVMDQRRGSLAAKAPLMFVNGAQSLAVAGEEFLKKSGITT